MRLIDAEDYLYRERPVGLSDELYQESHLYKSIMEQEVIQAIPLEKVKQARKDIHNAHLKMLVKHGSGNLLIALEILDNLIESEEK